MQLELDPAKNLKVSKKQTCSATLDTGIHVNEEYYPDPLLLTLLKPRTVPYLLPPDLPGDALLLVVYNHHQLALQATHGLHLDNSLVKES